MSAPESRKRVRERFGSIELEIETLADLDAAVERLLERAQEDPPALERDLCPYFGVVWPAARALADTLVERSAEVAGTTLLELGCGLAVPSLLATRLGARVTATDLHPDVPDFLARNLALNGLAPDALEYLELDWRGAELGRRFDWVVGSDVLYEAGHPGPVARALAAHVAPGGRILLADPARAYLQPCLDELRALGFQERTEVVRVSDPGGEDTAEAPTREVFLIELLPRGAARRD